MKVEGWGTGGAGNKRLEGVWRGGGEARNWGLKKEKRRYERGVGGAGLVELGGKLEHRSSFSGGGGVGLVLLEHMMRGKERCGDIRKIEGS